MVGSSSATVLAVVQASVGSLGSDAPRSSHHSQESIASLAASNGHSSGASVWPDPVGGVGLSVCLSVCLAKPGLKRSQQRLKADDGNAERLEASMGRSNRAVEIDAAAGIVDNDDLEPGLAGVLRRITHAKIER